MRHYARQRERRGVGIEASAHELQVGRDPAQVGVGCTVGQVAEAEGLPDFAGGEEFLELWRNVLVEAGCIGGGKGGVAFAGMSIARSGMWRSPITRTRRDVIVGVVVGVWRAAAW